jgi:hypothetical protein
VRANTELACIGGRLRATAVYDVDTVLGTSGSVTFPTQATADTVPFTSSTTIAGSCPTLTTSFTGGYFDVTTFDYDSNGNGSTSGDINEGTSATSLFASTVPDMLVTRRVHSAQSSTNTTQASECTVLERLSDSNSLTGRGDVTTIRRYGDGGSLVEQTDLTHRFAVAPTNTNSNDRISELDRYRVVAGGPSDAETYWLGNTSGAYDDEGKLVSYTVPQTDGETPPHALTSITVTVADGQQSSTDLYANRRVTTVTDGTTTQHSFEKLFAWGFQYSRGNGTNAGGTGNGNYSVTQLDGTTTDATKALDVYRTGFYDSSGNLLHRDAQVQTRDSYGRVTQFETLNTTSLTLRQLRNRTIDTGGVGQDRVSSDQDEVTTTPTYVTTSYTYQADNWDALASTTEADGDVECYVFGTSGSEAGRVNTLSRGTACPGTV